MSKAFTRESDDLPERPALRRLPPSIVSGDKNLLTPDGARRFHEELRRLVEADRPAAAAMEDRVDAQERLRLLDQRIRQIQEILGSAVVVQPATGPDNRVRFGSTVTVRGLDGEESRYRLVGEDETDLDRNWVSWRSPLARALLNSQKGARVRLRLPSGEKELEVMEVTYE